MDEKEVRDVIKLLELYIEGYNYIIRRNPDDELRCLKAIEKKNQLETAIEALEKQLAKKITDTIVTSFIHGTIKEGTCPRCGNPLDIGKFCNECGQRIDWSEQS